MVENRKILIEEDYIEVIKRIDALADAGFEQLTKEQEDLLVLLTDLIEAYEKEHCPI